MAGLSHHCKPSSLFSLVAHNPRRAIHSFKVGLALALTSLTVLQEDLFKQLGANAIWAVMTVVVVFELTAGATFCKGSNRAFGTLLAGTLALGVEYLADLAGPSREAYVVGFSVFVVGTTATFTRFCEPFKSKYDYGVMIFLLTFSLIIVSGYRVTDNLQLAVSRFLNIVLGGVVCLVVTMVIKPIWAGEDLHNIIRKNLDSLAGALEECVKAYFKESLYHPPASPEDDPIYDLYKAVLVSKPNEESLANFASWEPRCCARVGSKGVWKQYLQVGGMLRNCTYIVASLHGCLISDVQAPYALRKAFTNPCVNIAMQSAALLKELGENIQRREKSKPRGHLMSSLLDNAEQLKRAVDEIYGKMAPPTDENPIISTFISKATDEFKLGKVAIEEETPIEGANYIADSMKGGPFTEFLAIAAVAFLLVELVSRLGHLVDAVKSLEKLAGFKAPITDYSNRPPIPMTDNSCFESLTVQTTE